MFNKAKQAISQAMESHRLLNELFAVVLTKDRFRALLCAADIAGRGAGPRTAVEFTRRGVLAGFSFEQIGNMYDGAMLISRTTGDDLFYCQEQLEIVHKSCPFHEPPLVV